MCSGVAKSGSPCDSEITSRPWRRNAAARAAISMVSAGAIPPRRSAMKLMLAPSASEALRDSLHLKELQQVVRPARLGVRPRQIEAAEGLHARQRAGALAIDVEVAHVEVAPGDLDAAAILRIQRAGQAVERVVDYAQ